ncbi:MAG: EAL domain-containing protein [Pseudomonadota bacterium]
MKFSDCDIIRSEMMPVDSTCEDLVKFFQRHPKVPLCPLGEHGVATFIVHRNSFQDKLNSPFGFALYAKTPATKFSEELRFSCEYTDKVSDFFTSRINNLQEISSGIVINYEGVYFGIVPGLEVMRAVAFENANLVTNLRGEIEMRRLAEAKIRHLADTDPLTGLLNRRAFMEKVKDFASGDDPFLCAFMDLDRFKQINDQFGHASGDLVLKTVATRISSSPQVSNSARFGGDEFAFLVKPSPGDGAEHTLNGMLKKVCSPIQLERSMIDIGASIGFAEYGTDANDFETLLQSADLAMLRVKSKGGGLERHHPENDILGLNDYALERRMREAIDQQYIKPALQPIHDVKTGKIIGYELLARWAGGSLSPAPGPDAFIPIAEKLGLLNDLLWSTLSQALGSRSWENLYLSINVSPSQLSGTGLLKGLRDILAHHGLDPSCIQIEITEGVIFRNLEASIKTLQHAQRLGMRIALDDFGTGFSSLSLLHRLPLDTVKIDRSFLGADNDTSVRRKVLSSILMLCRELDVSSCMEGVEDKPMMDLVCELGCDQAQGYYLGSPELVAHAPRRAVA